MHTQVSVRSVLLNPSATGSNDPLAVAGVLRLDDGRFHLLHDDGMKPDQGLALPIDDPLAAQRLRETLGQPRPGGCWYFGRAIVEARTRHRADGWALYEVVTMTLDEWEDRGPQYLRVRPHPGG